ncbi:hypothetical protein [Corallococcus sp. 4LFB]|uniref:hypothetical protein n=1 Tax=Corallococcus sp. 4LFB TaxID=3383249 RepID=UPI003974F9F0
MSADFATGVFNACAADFAAGAFGVLSADFATGVFKACAPDFAAGAFGACAADFAEGVFFAGAAFAVDAFAAGFALGAGAFATGFFAAALFIGFAVCFSFEAAVFSACATGFATPVFFAGAGALPPAGRPPGFVAALPAALRDLDESGEAEGRVRRRWAIKSSSEDPSGRRRRPSSPDG